MSLNQFGNFRFVSIAAGGDNGGPPLLPTTHLEMVQRPGFDGCAFIALGRKGQPFQMRSFVDTEDFPSAVQLAANYQDYQGQGPYGLIWGGINSVTAFGTVYVPVLVIPTKIKRLRSARGGIYPPSLACVECMWTLVPVALPD